MLFNVCLDLLNVWLALVVVSTKKNYLLVVCGVSQKIEFVQLLIFLWESIYIFFLTEESIFILHV
jgi:hypothetical protein